jgi:hypothetical protein
VLARAWGFESPLRHYPSIDVYDHLQSTLQARCLSIEIYQNLPLSIVSAVSFAVSVDKEDTGYRPVGSGSIKKEQFSFSRRMMPSPNLWKWFPVIGAILLD